MNLTSGFQHYPVQGTLTEGEKLSTVNLLVLTSLDQLIFILKILFTVVTRQADIKRRSTVPSLPFLLAFPAPVPCLMFPFNCSELNPASTKAFPGPQL